MKRKRRWLTILGALLAAVVIAAAVVLLSIGRSGSGALERWIGYQLQLIANSYLNPRLSFTDLDYTYPGTVSLKDLRLTADDPSSPGRTIDIIGCGQATITLAEVPQVGKPIVIEKIILERPLFSAVATEPNSSQFIGFSNLLRGEETAAEQPPASQPRAQPPEPAPRLSDVFQMRLVQLIDGRIVYDPRIAGTDPMELDQINTRLDIQPAAEPGWYRLDTSIARRPVFDLSVAGQLNLDTFRVQDAVVKLLADLDEQKLNYLPPQLQKILRQYEARGMLEMNVSGSMPLMQPLQGDLRAAVKLSGANVTLGEHRIPIENFDLAARFADGRIDLSELKIDALHGSLRLSGSAVLNERLDADVKLTVVGMLLQDLLASRKEGEPLKLAGKVDAQIVAAAPLKVVAARVQPPATQPSTQPWRWAEFASQPLPSEWGWGTLAVTEARLVQIPFIHDLSERIAQAAKIVKVPIAAGGKPPPPRERIHAAFSFRGDAIQLTDLEYVGEVVAARGKGSIGLDQRLDLTLNGGPIEKVQAMLGKEVGGAIAMVTDRVLAYHVTGSLNEPKVEVLVGGGTVQQTAKTAETGVKKIGEGIGKGLGTIGRQIGRIGKKKDEE
ncbi:hypothetical protein [Fontivita pretiosa]|uniref:hypothetical protein n=1 Tax=Fontivita pretiosa TaxID=2989684 RepID=UPI003D165442